MGYNPPGGRVGFAALDRRPFRIGQWVRLRLRAAQKSEYGTDSLHEKDISITSLAL